MAKVDLGTKRTCPSCEAKFYDLTRSPATCPMCQNGFDPEELLAGAAVAAMKEKEGPLKDYDAESAEEEDEELAAEEGKKKEVISYFDGSNANLKIVKCSNTSC